jgi:anti-sigma factor ChrR (cupin superfamily)
MLPDESDNSLNGDMSKRIALRTSEMDWQPSPSGSVWRKRLHLVGGAESGQVTSVVRYEKGAMFAEHDHPEGEEILVLDGVFSDEHGDWPAGTYLLNPEGFRHAPFSEPGCLLFVKLRQYAGAVRHHITLCTRDVAWQPADRSGAEEKILYAHPDFSDAMRLERWAPGTATEVPNRTEGAEVFVLEGSLEHDSESYDPLSWLRFPVGEVHHLATREGCVLYIKTGALGSLRSTG